MLYESHCGRWPTVLNWLTSFSQGGGGVLTGQGRAWLESQQLCHFPVKAGEACVLFLHVFIACLFLLLEIGLCSSDLLMSSLFVRSAWMISMERDI